jgi:16S rRNA (cytidine1402-2'-O)-methyltransferase
MPGRLYVVSTPIGNLEDMTYRAVRVLGEVGWVACEDTRHSRKLLDHYAIRTPMVSYHEHNEAERAAELIARLLAGESGALISDAGTPLVSDPGYRLVHAARKAGIAVEAVPGASALLAALVASGLATDEFHFAGFLPPKQGARLRALEALEDEKATLIFYEAPHRMLDTLADVEIALPGREIVVARELTKLHEEVLRGAAGALRAELAGRDAVKGEFVILVGRAAAPAADDSPIEDALVRLTDAGMSRMDAMKAVARERGLSKREVYKLTNPTGGSKPKDRVRN